MLLSFLGISQSLPSTSYIKLIDIWMIFTMIYPFVETLLVCLKDVVKTKSVVVRGAKKAQQHNHISYEIYMPYFILLDNHISQHINLFQQFLLTKISVASNSSSTRNKDDPDSRLALSKTRFEVLLHPGLKDLRDAANKFFQS